MLLLNVTEILLSLLFQIEDYCESKEIQIPLGEVETLSCLCHSHSASTLYCRTVCLGQLFYRLHHDTLGSVTALVLLTN